MRHREPAPAPATGCRSPVGPLRHPGASDSVASGYLNPSWCTRITIKSSCRAR